MKEPENLTLRLLREFREEFRDYRKEFAEYRALTEERFVELTRLFAGEGVLARYATAGIDRRLDDREKRMSALEEQP